MLSNNRKLGQDLLTALRDKAAPDLVYISYLVAEGADLSVRDDMGATAIYLAACFGHADVVKILIHAGADINQPSDHGATPLAVAAQYGHMSCVTTLIDAHAHLDTQDKLGYTPLMWAAYKGYTDMVVVLAEAGADLLLKSRDGHTAGYLAWSMDYDDIAGRLSYIQTQREEAVQRRKIDEVVAQGIPSKTAIRIVKCRKPKM